MDVISNKIQTFPKEAQGVAEHIRFLIHQTAKEKNIAAIEESLKWGEASFKAPKGTPLRFDWKAKNPDSFNIYFNCQSLMIEWIKTEFGELLDYEGNRAIYFKINTPPSDDILKRIIELALLYHQLK